MVQRTTQSIVVAAAPSAVNSVVLDCYRYCEWVADLTSTDVLECDADGRAPDAVSSYQSSGDVTRELLGSYSFRSRDALDNETTVTYELEVELAVPLAQFIRSRATHRIQRQALSEIKHCVEELS